MMDAIDVALRDLEEARQSVNSYELKRDILKHLLLSSDAAILKAINDAWSPGFKDAGAALVEVSSKIKDGYSYLLDGSNGL